MNNALLTTLASVLVFASISHPYSNSSPNCPAVLADELCSQLQEKNETDFVRVRLSIRVPDSLVDHVLDPKQDTGGGSWPGDSKAFAYLKAVAEKLFTDFDLRSMENPDMKLAVPGDEEIWYIYGYMLATKSTIMQLSEESFIGLIEPFREKEPVSTKLTRSFPTIINSEVKYNILGRKSRSTEMRFQYQSLR